MLIREITIPVGAVEPFSVLHTSDNHICLADERDNERKRKLAAERGMAISKGHPEQLTQKTEEIFAYAKEHQLPVFHTGDLIDFVSEANLDYARNLLKDADVFVAAGNHEFSQYVGETWEDEAYKAQSFEHVKAAFPGDFWFQIRMINGVKFIALENGYYYVTEEQLRLFKEATAEDVPTVLLVHNPLYSADTFHKYKDGRPASEPAYLFGCPEDLMWDWEESRRLQQRPNEVTKEFMRYCEQLSCLKAVLAGHMHVFLDCKLDSGIPQYVASGGYKSDVNVYTFV